MSDQSARSEAQPPPRSGAQPSGVAEAQPPLSIGVRDLRAELAANLVRVEAGETIVVNRGGRPVARLVPLSEPPGRHAGIGLEDMARLGLAERPRSDPATRPTAGQDSSVAATRPLPIDVRVDRIVRQVRG